MQNTQSKALISTKSKFKLQIAFLCGLLTCLLACKDASKPADKQAKLAMAIFPTKDQKIKLGDTVFLQAILPDGKTADSICYFLDQKPVGCSLHKLAIPTKHLALGLKQWEAQVYVDGSRQNVSGRFYLLSNAPPLRYGYAIVKKYPHDKKAYCQGLEYHQGLLYESTGQYGASSLRKVSLKTGKVIRQHNLEPIYFGEGLTLFDGRLLQLTWQNGMGFIYDPASFLPVGTFVYGNSLAGWGLCSDKKSIYKSDGSEKIWFLNPKNLQEAGYIEVYDHNGAVTGLNELEWVEGLIYANVYPTNEVVMIDPSNGKVLGRIDLTGLLKPEDIQTDTDVLNGIAYDAKKQRLFVTGKNWPWLFEIRLLKKE